MNAQQRLALRTVHVYTLRQQPVRSSSSLSRLLLHEASGTAAGVLVEPLENQQRQLAAVDHHLQPGGGSVHAPPWQEDPYGTAKTRARLHPWARTQRARLAVAVTVESSVHYAVFCFPPPATCEMRSRGESPPCTQPPTQATPPTHQQSYVVWCHERQCTLHRAANIYPSCVHSGRHRHTTASVARFTCTAI